MRQMLERFTRAARTVVEDAVVLAREAVSTEVRPEHLLQAMLADEECLAVRVLAGQGVPVGRLRAELDRLRTRYVDGLDADDAEALAAIGIDLDEVVRRIDRNLGRSGAERRRPRFSRPAKKTLELALREAVALRHSHIGTEHLLLGLVRVEDRVVADALATCDVELDGLRAAVADAVREAG
jgi:ATP-dependent Clp protease ATP-binding subunit ClpA